MQLLDMTLTGFVQGSGERVTGIKRKSQEECDHEQVTGEGTWGSSLGHLCHGVENTLAHASRTEAGRAPLM